VEKVVIVFQQEAVNFLDKLIEILYVNGYFAFIESSEDYVAKIYDFIEDHIIDFPHKKTPAELKNFSPNYIFFKINPRTTWYIFFEKNNQNYLITHIINNHCEEAKYF
jgi:hypothetical protein